MSVKDPVHLILGCVDIKGENGFAERFINLCTAEGIPLWDIHKRNGEITAKTTVSGFKKIRRPARQSSMRVRLVRKRGLPFIVNRIMRRTGLVIGFALMLLTLSILSGRIWIIEVDNSTSIPTKEILDAYEASGFSVGASKHLDLNILCADASTKLDEASWTTVNIIGSTATIKVREAKQKPQIDEIKGTANVVALKDGQVEIIEPYRGSAAVREGQTVTKGGLLISGVTESRIQSNIFSDAEGYVVAKTTISVKNSTSARSAVLLPECRKVYSIYFLGKEIPLGRKSSGNVCRHENRLCIGGRKMPFGIYCDIYTDFTEKEITISERENLLTAINNYSLEAYHSTLHTQNISKEVSIQKSKNEYNISGIYHCYENIGQKVPFEIEETEVSDELQNVGN